MVSTLTSTLKRGPTPKALVPSLLLLLILTQGISLAIADSLDSARLNWSQLEYRATKLGLSVSATIELNAISSGQAASRLINPGTGEGIKPATGGSLYMKMHTTMLGRDMQTKLWFDPQDARILQRERYETGIKRNEYKVYRYTTTGTFSLKKRPNDGEESLAPDNWHDISKGFDPYQTTGNNRIVFTEAPTLFYIVSVANLSKAGDAVLVHTMSRGKLIPVELRVVAEAPYTTEYVAASAQSNRAVHRTAPALQISIEAQSTDGDSDDLKLAGLEKNLTFFIDKETRLPLELRGDVKVFGTIRFRLQQVALLD